MAGSLADRVKTAEHCQIHLALVASALLKANSAECSHELRERKVAVGVCVELGKDFCHIPSLVALLGIRPELRVELPPAVEPLLELLAHVIGQVGFELDDLARRGKGKGRGGVGQAQVRLRWANVG